MMQRPTNSLFDKKRITLFFVIIISFFSLIYSPARSELTRLIYPIASRFFYVGDKVAAVGSSFVTNFRDKQALVYENSMLRAENSQMQALVLDRSLLLAQVSKLQELLGQKKVDNRVVANVIIGFSQSLYDTLTINAGTDQGVKNGDPVVYTGSGVIGQIAEASSSSAKVKLYSSPGEEYLVIVGSHFIPATAHGKGDGNFEAKVPQGSAIAIGDTVSEPKDNLILGTVFSVDQKEGSPFATVLFRSSFNPTEVRLVEVIIGGH